MAWRPTQYLIEGELDNTDPGRVTGWMQFAGMNEKVTFDLKGDFHRDIRGAKIHFTGDAYEDQADVDPGDYLDGLAQHQTGKVGEAVGEIMQKIINQSHVVIGIATTEPD